MLSVRSRVFLNAESLGRLSRPMMIGSARKASYSKNPMKKDGTLESLIYNDALYRGKQHLLPEKYNPDRIGCAEVPASWHIPEPKVSWEASPRGYKEPVLSEKEKYAIPEHQYNYFATPFVGNCTGGMINQRIRYDELLPRCKGKLSKLEWSHLTEEDRYTRRNFVIRNAQRRYGISMDFKGNDDTNAGMVPMSRFEKYWRVGFAIFFALVINGFPGTNSRSMNTVDPDNQSETHTDAHWLASVPVLGDFLGNIQMGTWVLFDNGLRGSFQNKIQAVPLWEDFGLSEVRSMDGHDRGKHISTHLFNNRDNSTVDKIPCESFREANTLYYDDAEGPDRIGGYNVHPWKTGSAESYNNAKASGCTANFYNGKSQFTTKG